MSIDDPSTHTTHTNFDADLWKDALYGQYRLHLAVWQPQKVTENPKACTSATLDNFGSYMFN